MAKLQLGYTVIQHGPRIHYGLSMNQYSLASAVYHLASNPKNPVLGWCWASKKTLAAYFGFSEKTVFNILGELVAAGWLEKHPSQADGNLDGANGLVRATARWYDLIECWTGETDPSGLPPAITTQGMQNLHTPPVQSLHTPYVNVTHNSNTNTNSGNTDVFSAQARTKKNRGKNAEVEPFLDAPTTADDSPPVADAPPAPLSEEADALLADMADYWNVSTERFFHSYALLARFIREQVALGELAFVSSQFYAYKSARNVQPHNLDNFLGKPGEWLGAWNKEDYSKKLTKRQAQDPNAQGDGKQSHLGQRLTSGNAAAQRLLDKRNARLQTQNEA